MRLRVELPDQDTLTIKRVPASQESFSKARTNLLIKRSTEGMPCVVCVDEDLDYMGTDQAMAQAFAAGPTQQGWRILALEGSLHGDLSAALEYALSILGADKESGDASAAPIAAGRTLLAAWAENRYRCGCRRRERQLLFSATKLSSRLRLAPLAGRAGWPLILGDSGTGKTNLAAWSRGLAGSPPKGTPEL